MGWVGTEGGQARDGRRCFVGGMLSPGDPLKVDGELREGGRVEDSEEQLWWTEHEEAPQKSSRGATDRKARYEGRKCLALHTWCRMCQYLSKTLLAISEKQSCRVIFANGYKRTAIVFGSPPLGFCMGSSHMGFLWSIHRLTSKHAFSFQFQYQLLLRSSSVNPGWKQSHLGSQHPDTILCVLFSQGH